MFVLENGQYAEITFEELQRREKEDKGYKDKYFLPLHGMLMEVTNHVPIPHNLETRDDTIITYIIENIEYGHPQSVNNDKIVDIETNYEFKGTLNENQFFYYTFTPKYTAKYSINTEDNTQLRKIVLDPELVDDMHPKS